VLQVSRAAYYKWQKAEPSAASVKRKKAIEEIKRIHKQPRMDDYGSPRMHGELQKQGIELSKNTVAKLMRDEGIRARCRRKYRVVTTDSKHDRPIAPNRLNQDFKAQKLNQVWLTDFTYIPSKEGFTYLCTVQDLCSRRIVGWATSRNIDTTLALDALNQAIALRNPRAGLIVHSDRGSQFASLAYQNRLSACEFQQSMSRKGNCYDNAPMESFFRSFKVEEVYWNEYQTHEQATRGVTDYIDRFYNRVRLHSSLDYLSPSEFENQES
jgi:transposase InsO family protein